MKKLLADIAIIEQKKRLCRFYISVNNVEQSIDGFILDSSKTFILIRECYNFEPRGFVVIEKSKINNIRYGRIERSFAKIFKAERLMEKIFSYTKMPLTNYVELLREIKKRYKSTIVESAYNEKLDFCIGEIISVNKESVSMLCFDVTGKIDKTPTKIPYAEILQVEFCSNYVNVFSKYLRE